VHYLLNNTTVYHLETGLTSQPVFVSMHTSWLIRIQQFIFKPSDFYFRITLLETPFTFLAGCFRGFTQFIQTYVGMELRNKLAYDSIQIGSRGSSVSIVSGYGLDDRAIEVRSPAETKDFSHNLCVQTGSGAHPASCTMGTGGPFMGLKRGRGVTLTTHSHLSRGQE
jgi:hypothetical protein